MLITLEFPEQALNELQQSLDPRAVGKATEGTVKKTTAHVLTKVRQEIRSQVTIDKKYIERATGKSISGKGVEAVGRVTIQRKPIPLIAFKSRELIRGGVSIKVGRDLPPIVLRHAFYATMRSGHEGIFLRSRSLPQSGPNAGKLNKHGRPLLKLTERGIAGRLRIEEQYGPSVLKMIDNPKTIAAISADAADFAVRTLANQVSYQTKGAFAGEAVSQIAEGAD